MPRFEKITLNQIRKHQPCINDWRKLLRHLGKTKADDAALSLNTILESNGLEDALWCMKALPENIEMQRKTTGLKVAFIAPIFHLMKDECSIRAVEVAGKFSENQATEKELSNHAVVAYAIAAGFGDPDDNFVALATTDSYNHSAACASIAAANIAAFAASISGGGGANYNVYVAVRKKAIADQKKMFLLWIFRNEE